MGSEGFSHFFRFSSFFFVFLLFSSLFFAFLRFSSFFFAFLRFSPILLGQGQTTAIYWENGEFHSDPVCTDPVRNFPTRLQDVELWWGRLRNPMSVAKRSWAQSNPSPTIANGRNTVSRVLFRKRELTEFCGKLGEFCERLGEFAFAHTHKK